MSPLNHNLIILESNRSISSDVSRRLGRLATLQWEFPTSLTCADEGVYTCCSELSRGWMSQATPRTKNRAQSLLQNPIRLLVQSAVPLARTRYYLGEKYVRSPMAVPCLHRI